MSEGTGHGGSTEGLKRKWCCMKRLGKGMLSTYAELHRHLEEEFDIKVAAEALRLRLIKDLIISLAILHTIKTSFESHIKLDDFCYYAQVSTTAI